MFLIVRFVYEIPLLPHCTAGGCFHLLSDIPYCLANFQHERRRNGKLVDSHAEGLLGKRRIRREFAAYSDPRVVLVGVLGAHLDEPQNRFVVSVDELLDVRVLTVARQRVLRKVVSTHAEEIHQRSQLVADERSRGSFYHNSEFHLVGIADVLRSEFGLDVLADGKL